MLTDLGPRQFCTDTLSTFLAEAAAIINVTPLTSISTLSDDPQPLTPAMLLNQKSQPHPPKLNILVFPVYHPRKKKLRLVFDASVIQQTSLIEHLLQGPDQTSSLYGVLCRFRENQVAVTGDIDSMFHCFYVNPEDRNFLRFFWWEDNNPVNDIVEYRMRVHLFGNRSSPGVAIHCLHFAADIAEGEDVMHFIKRNFYVDDGLGSFDTVDDAIRIIASTRRALSNYNIRLHKLMSSHAEVLQAFAPTEVAQEIQMNTLSDTNVPRILGVLWDVHSDCFRIRYTPLDIKLTKEAYFPESTRFTTHLDSLHQCCCAEGKFSGKLLQSNTSSVSNMHRWIQPPLYLGTTCCPRKRNLRFLLGSSISQKSTKYLFLDSLSTHNA